MFQERVGRRPECTDWRVRSTSTCLVSPVTAQVHSIPLISRPPAARVPSKSSAVFPSTGLEARLPQSADHIQQRTRTPGGPPRTVFRQALVFSPVLVTAANRHYHSNVSAHEAITAGQLGILANSRRKRKELLGRILPFAFRERQLERAP